MPVVRFLLKHGVTWNEFGELSKEAYVKVAREDYGIDGRPTNNSRVAMLTGLSRREVARVRDQLLQGTERAAEPRGNQILSTWLVNRSLVGLPERSATSWTVLPGAASKLSKRLRIRWSTNPSSK